MGIYDRAWRDPPSVEGTPRGAVGPEGCPRHARWIPTREVVYPIRSSCTKVLALLYREGCRRHFAGFLRVKLPSGQECVVGRSPTKPSEGQRPESATSRSATKPPRSGTRATALTTWTNLPQLSSVAR